VVNLMTTATASAHSGGRVLCTIGCPPPHHRLGRQSFPKLVDCTSLRSPNRHRCHLVGTYLLATGSFVSVVRRADQCFDAFELFRILLRGDEVRLLADGSSNGVKLGISVINDVDPADAIVLANFDKWSFPRHCWEAFPRFEMLWAEHFFAKSRRLSLIIRVNPISQLSLGRFYIL
jgi:hypothetical protein